MKKIILIFILVLSLPTKIFAETDEIMKSTQEKFNISEFIEQAEK